VGFDAHEPAVGIGMEGESKVAEGHSVRRAGGAAAGARRLRARSVGSIELSWFLRAPRCKGLA
jgi:hypothetical protein